MAGPVAHHPGGSLPGQPSPPIGPSHQVGSARPFAERATRVLLWLAAALALASAIGHVVFGGGLWLGGQLDDMPDLGPFTWFWLGECGKVLVVPAGLAFRYGLRSGARWTRMVTSWSMAGCAVAVVAATLYDAAGLLIYSMLGVYVAASEAAYAGDDGGDTGVGRMVLGIAVVGADLLLCVVALACMITALIWVPGSGPSRSAPTDPGGALS